MDNKSKLLPTIVAILAAISLIATSACTSMRAVPVPAGPMQPFAVEVGDRVRVTEKNGEQKEFDVTALEADALRGANVRVSYCDIELLEVRRIDKGKTAGLIAAIVGVVLVIAGQIVKGYSELWNSAP